MAVDFTYGGPTILQSPIFVEFILPFILVFVVVFAILQKSEIVGKGKRQMDAIVALVIGLFFVAFADAVGLVVRLMPILAVGLVVLLVLFLLWGFAYGPGEFKMHDYVKYTIGGLAVATIVIAMVYFTGIWNVLTNYFETDFSNLLYNGLIIAGVIGAVVLVFVSAGKSSSSGSGSGH